MVSATQPRNVTQPQVHLEEELHFDVTLGVICEEHQVVLAHDVDRCSDGEQFRADIRTLGTPFVRGRAIEVDVHALNYVEV